jgi:hypothetical protein
MPSPTDGGSASFERCCAYVSLIRQLKLEGTGILEAYLNAKLGFLQIALYVQTKGCGCGVTKPRVTKSLLAVHEQSHTHFSFFTSDATANALLPQAKDKFLSGIWTPG